MNYFQHMKSYNLSYENSFEPNLTTAMLYEAAKIKIDALLKQKQTIDVLELGCGCGVISLILKNEYKDKINVSLSDLETNSIKDAKENFSKYKIIGNIKACSLFDGWTGKYDVIINDISGISEPIAKLSPWFTKSSCATGEAGTDLLDLFFKDVAPYTKNHTVLLFPLLSFSKWESSLNIIKKNFILNEFKVTHWPIPNNIDIDKLTQACKHLGISLEKKFDNFIAWTKVYDASIK